jgi:hypothetical protein
MCKSLFVHIEGGSLEELEAENGSVAVTQRLVARDGDGEHTSRLVKM